MTTAVEWLDAATTARRRQHQAEQVRDLITAPHFLPGDRGLLDTLASQLRLAKKLESAAWQEYAEAAEERFRSAAEHDMAAQDAKAAPGVYSEQQARRRRYDDLSLSVLDRLDGLGSRDGAA